MVAAPRPKPATELLDELIEAVDGHVYGYMALGGPEARRDDMRRLAELLERVRCTRLLSEAKGR